MTTPITIANEHAAAVAEAEHQIAFLKTAGPDDLAAVIAVMERAVDDDADPRLAEGVAALRRAMPVADASLIVSPLQSDLESIEV
ncbi:hypothetical protein [Mesorhizobium marinum]|uniref:hypothetical protein n=1 Tax=Mesorhizobium marinum TaxID=3228790 RepID=UPI003465E085